MYYSPLKRGQRPQGLPTPYQTMINVQSLGNEGFGGSFQQPDN